MKCISGKEIKSFPIVFYSGRYEGEYMETCRLLKILISLILFFILFPADSTWLGDLGKDGN